MYNMKDEYKIGITELDRHNERIFELLDEIYIVITSQFYLNKFDKLQHLITALNNFVLYHFKCEEDCMSSINYEKLLTQKYEHATFLKMISDFDIEKLKKTDAEYILYKLNELNGWLVGHILEQDKQITSAQCA